MPRHPKAPPITSLLDARIPRRDFVNGVLVGTAGLLLGGLSACKKGKGSDTSAVGDTSPVDDSGTPDGFVSNDTVDEYEVCHQLWHGDTWELPTPEGELVDCVIIGGGIAGLVTAWQLQKAGVGVQVLDKNDVVGGQCRRDETGVTLASMASAFTDIPYNAQLVELFTDLGVVTGTTSQGHPIVDDTYLVGRPYDQHFIDGSWYANPFESEEAMAALPYSDAIKADLTDFLHDMMRWYMYWGTDDKGAFEIPMDETASTDAVVRELDDITFLEYVKGKGWDPQVAAFFDSLIRSEFGTTHDKVSAYAAIANISADIYPSDEDDVISLPGGNAHIALGLADLIGAEAITLNASVIRVENTDDDEVHVWYLVDGQVQALRARAAVYAAPRFLAPYVIPELDASKESAFFQYCPYIVANVHVSQTPSQLVWISQLQGDFMVSDIIVADWTSMEDPASASPDRPNILTVYVPLTDSGARMDLLNDSLQEWEDRILAELEVIVPGVVDTITRFDLYRWGHPMVIPTPGFVFGDTRVASKQALGRISFVGHETEGLPIIDTAIASGFRGATEVADLLS